MPMQNSLRRDIEVGVSAILLLTQLFSLLLAFLWVLCIRQPRKLHEVQRHIDQRCGRAIPVPDGAEGAKPVFGSVWSRTL